MFLKTMMMAGDEEEGRAAHQSPRHKRKRREEGGEKNPTQPHTQRRRGVEGREDGVLDYGGLVDQPPPCTNRKKSKRRKEGSGCELEGDCAFRLGLREDAPAFHLVDRRGVVGLAEKVRRRGVHAESTVEETMVDCPPLKEEASSKGDSIRVQHGQDGRASHAIEEHERVHLSKKRRKQKEVPETTIDHLEKAEEEGASFYLQHGNEMIHLSKKKRRRAAIHAESTVEETALACLKKKKKKKMKKKKKRRRAQGTMEAGGENLREEQELKQTKQHHGGNENTKHVKDATTYLTDEHCRTSSAGNISQESSKKIKKVTFSDQHEVWQGGFQREKLDADILASEVNELDTSIDDKQRRSSSHEDENCVWGKRFTVEEDEIIKCAVLDYIKACGWSEEIGLKMILNSKKYKEARNCWANIRGCLPHRPKVSIWYRAHVLFDEGRRSGNWSKEENNALIKMQEEHGHNWRKISVLLGRGRQNIKEKWRNLKRSKAKGRWNQDDLQKLSDLVHKCLRLKAMVGSSRSKTDHRVIRDDINWEVIADEIGCHGHGSCCSEWYYTLASSMVASGEWSNEDDRLLLQRLLESGACSEEEVEWDQLLEHRPGLTCMTRWRQMQKHLGENQRRQFLEKLDLLSQRYAPELLEG